MRPAHWSIPGALTRLTAVTLTALLLGSCGGERSSGAAGSAPRLLAAAAPAPAHTKADYRAVLQRVYLAYFGRPADPAGLDYFAAGFVQAGAPTEVAGLEAAYASNPIVKSIIDGFGTSAESAALYPRDNNAFITAVYQNLFNRAPDAAGRAYWVAALDAGAISRGSAAVAVMAGAQTSDATSVTNKAQVSSNFTDALNTSLRLASYDGLAANTVARTMLGQVGAATDPAAFQGSVEASIATLAGTLSTPGIYLLAGSPGGTGNLNGPAAAARFGFYSSASGVAVDAAGNVYVADYANQVIRKIATDGQVSTFAGAMGQPGDSDGAPGQARLNYPQGLAIDGAGNLYVASAQMIRKITPAGTVSTFAGTTASGSADGSGAAARFNAPSSLAIDGAGNLYVADQVNNTVRKITPQALVSTVAGSAGTTRANVDGVGAAARFNRPQGIAVDASGALFVADSGNRTLRRIGTDGTVTTVAGTPGVSGSADGAGPSALFAAPRALVAVAGTLYVTDANNHTVRKVSGANGTGATVSTLAGQAGAIGDVNGAGGGAHFSYPGGIALDGAGALLVTTAAAVRRVALDGSTSTLAGLGWQVGAADGAGGAARFGLLEFGGALLADGGGVLVADQGNGTLRQVTPAGIVSTVAGVAGDRHAVDGVATSARFGDLRGLARDAAGLLYVSGDAAIRKVAADGSVSTFAGQAGSSGNVDGVGTAARFGGVNAMVFDGAGNLYVLDVQNAAGLAQLRKITPAGVVSTFARVGTYAEGLAIDAAGYLYVAGNAENVIVKVTPDGTVSTLAGVSGQAGSTDGVGAAARLNGPGGIVYDPAGKLYVIEAGGGLLREVGLDGSVRTLAGTVGVLGLGVGTTLPGSLASAWGIAWLGPKTLAIGIDTGVLKIILP